MRRDIVTGFLLLAIGIIFTSRIEQWAPEDAVFPWFVLIVLLVSGAVLAVRGVLSARRAATGADPQPEEETHQQSQQDQRVDKRILAAGAALLLGWGVAFGLFGFTLSGVVAFLAVVWLIRRGSGSPKVVILDITVAVVFVVACFLIFTRLLMVPLPVSVWLGI